MTARLPFIVGLVLVGAGLAMLGNGSVTSYLSGFAFGTAATLTWVPASNQERSR